MRFQIYPTMCCIELFLPLLAVLITKGSCAIQTNTGPVKGKMVASGKVEAFLGIPYAEPPIGPLRLSKPVAKKIWQEVYDATRLPPPCIQLKLTNVSFVPQDYSDMTEDCLYLNLWVPRFQSTVESKTIMLFIPGGGYYAGASNLPLYNGAKLAAYGDVIVVTINYRVGGLGFLTDFTDDAPGSVGLYDQVMAMKWIKENAKHFNGDPENIVLFGESAGAYSVSFHQISPLSKNLFKRAILESGSAISPVYDDNNADLKRSNQMYADLVGCKNDDTYINCLRELPAEKFSEIDVEVFLKRSKFQNLRVGNDFLPESTIDAFRKGHFKFSEVLMGINKDEGTLLLNSQRPDLFGSFGEKVVESMYNETTTYRFIKNMIQIDSVAVDKIIRSYMDDVNDEKKYTYLKAASDAVGDYLITCGNIFQAEYQSSRGNPVFFYMFDHRPAYTPLAEWMGVAHFDEVQFVFGNPMQNSTEYEKELSRSIMDIWVKFAKTGNPNTLGWLKYSHQHPQYLVIGKRDSVGLRPDHYRCEKWRDLFRSFIDEDTALKS